MNPANEKTDHKPDSAGHSAKPVNFYCPAPLAKRACLAGDFNDWQPIPMKQREDGWWVLQVRVPHGHHQYRFLVDGEPMLDVHAAGIARDESGDPVSLVAVS